MGEALPPTGWRDRRQVEAAIGPVRHVLGPHWTHRLWAYVSLVPVLVLGTLVAILAVFCGLHAGGALPRLRGGSGSLIGATAFLGLLVAGALAVVLPRFRCLWNRLLVGEGGLAEWTPAGATVVLAGDLGVSWVLHAPDAWNNGLPYKVLLALRHVASGAVLYITSYYAGSGAVARLLREKLTAARPGRWADLSLWQPTPVPTRTPGPEITPAGPREVREPLPSDDSPSR